MEEEQIPDRVKAIFAALEEQMSAFYATFGKSATIAMLKGFLKAARKLPDTPNQK